MGRRGHSAGARRQALDLLSQGRSVRQVATAVGVADQTIYNWRRQEQIDAGNAPGLTTSERSELQVANRKVKRLEAEIAIYERSLELLKESANPKVDGPL